MSETETTPRLLEKTRKLTVSSVTGGAKVWFEKLMKEHGDGSPMQLCTISGFVARAVPQIDAATQREYVRFLGSFEGVNLITGEVTRAGQCILPDFVNGELEAALKGEGVTTVQFAFLFEVMYDPTCIAKYMFKVKGLLPPAENDPLSEMRAKITKALGLTPDVAQLEDHSNVAQLEDHSKATGTAGKRKR